MTTKITCTMHSKLAEPTDHNRRCAMRKRKITSLNGAGLSSGTKAASPNENCKHQQHWRPNQGPASRYVA